ncbi:MAG: hypothetical protein AB1782_09680 [Cyanobacteriota bacterium]
MVGFYNIQQNIPPQQMVQQRPVNAPVYNQPVYQQPVQTVPVYAQQQVQVANNQPMVAERRTFDPNKLPSQYAWLTRPVKSTFDMPQPKVPFYPQQSQLMNINAKGLASEIRATAGPDGSRVPKSNFVNDLKSLFQQNKSIIEAIVIRTFGAADDDKNGFVEHNKSESGTFLNAINRLDELKARGINTLHVLPISEVGKINKLGEAGSIYAPLDYNKIAQELDAPGNGLNVRDEMKIFVNECHKRGIRVMVDLPSCGSIDMTKTNPDWFLRDRDGNLKVPGTWRDIRMFDPYTNRDTGELRQSLFEMHKEFVRNMIDIGVDGIRADVARAKPSHFWKPLIEYSHQLDPNFAWLAESYIHEDASPMANIPADRPEDLLRAGFDSFYGQYHILQSMKNATEVHKYIIDNINMTQRLPKAKSMIGTFYTHDDKSVMEHGGPLYGQFASAFVSTLPMVNLYYINGFETGDAKQMDIFNYVNAPKGSNPQLVKFIAAVNKMKEQYSETIGLGHYVPLEVQASDKEDKIIAFARHYNGKTLLVIANKDINARHIGKIKVPTLKGSQPLNDIVPVYGAKSRLAVQEGSVAVDLAPGRVHVFEIDTPNILANVQEAYRQNL